MIRALVPQASERARRVKLNTALPRRPGWCMSKNCFMIVDFPAAEMPRGRGRVETGEEEEWKAGGTQEEDLDGMLDLAGRGAEVGGGGGGGGEEALAGLGEAGAEGEEGG